MRRIVNLFVLLALVAAPAFAGQRASTAPTPMPGQRGGAAATPQTAPPERAREVTPEPRAPSLPGIPSNIRLDISVTDTYSGTPTKKTVSMMVMNGAGNMIRTSNRLSFSNGESYNVSLNVDAIAMLHANGLITLRLTFQYTPAQGSETAAARRPADLNESLTVILQDGKTLMLSQSADPATERKVTLEATATVVK